MWRPGIHKLSRGIQFEGLGPGNWGPGGLGPGGTGARGLGPAGARSLHGLLYMCLTVTVPRNMISRVCSLILSYFALLSVFGCGAAAGC